MSQHHVDTDQLRALGHGLMAFINLAILLAIGAVILSANSNAPAVIKSAFDFVAWLVAQVVRPVSGGTSVTLSDKLAPAGAVPASSAGS